MNISRRNFIKKAGLATVGLVGGEFTQIAALAKNANPSCKPNILVVVQMNGGNDGLNTVIPYGDGMYYQLRKTLSVPPDAVLDINGKIGFNPNLQGFTDLYNSNKLSIIQGVGYPNQNCSHCRSMEIWQTGIPDKIGDHGWLGRYLDLFYDGKTTDTLPAINLDSTLPKTLLASKIIVPTAGNAHRSFDSNDPFDTNDLFDPTFDPNDSFDLNYSFSDKLKFIARMIYKGIGAKIYHVSLSGFDTHENQAQKHNDLLKQLGDGLATFQRDLESHDLENNVLVFCFSEFGRCAIENFEQGTNHGAAAPVFLIGSAVKGGLYGDNDDLTCFNGNNLQNGLKYQIDFRSVYASILERWLSADSRQILGAHYDQIPFV